MLLSLRSATVLCEVRKCETCTVEIVYNEHQDQAEFARYNRSRDNRYRYNHIRASTRPDFSTKSTRYTVKPPISGQPSA